MFVVNVTSVLVANLIIHFAHCSPNGGHSTTGDFDSEVESTISSRRGGPKRRDKHSSRGSEGILYTMNSLSIFCQVKLLGVLHARIDHI